MKIREIKFKNKKKGYSIFIGKNSLNLLSKKIKILCPKTKKIAIIFDKKVPTKFKNSLSTNLKNYDLSFLPFEASEKNKSINIVNNSVYNNIL